MGKPTSVIAFTRELIDYYDLLLVTPDEWLTLVDASEVMEMLFEDDFPYELDLAEAREHLRKRDEAEILLRLTLCNSGLTWQ